MSKKILITGGSGFIGTNLVNYCMDNDISFVNLDKNEPKIVSHFDYWKECDILNLDKVIKLFSDYNPTHVVHLAARTDIEGNTIEDYKDNTEGTKNILKAIECNPSIRKVVITSTQFVHQNNSFPKTDVDFKPHTIYGESKVITEELTRNANINCTWTIVRPTNIWGPWHQRYPYEFWKILGKGLYIHPGKKRVIRSYGFVGNVIWQIIKIIEAPDQIVNRKVFYLGDKPINLIEWVNGFSIKQRGKRVPIVPRVLVKSAANIGDCFSLFGINFPITYSRYKSMTTNNPAPMDFTFNTFGQPPFSLADGIDITVVWLKAYYPELVKIQSNT